MKNIFYKIIGRLTGFFSSPTVEDNQEIVDEMTQSIRDSMSHRVTPAFMKVDPQRIMELSLSVDRKMI